MWVQVTGHEGAFRRRTSSVGSYCIGDGQVNVAYVRDARIANIQTWYVCISGRPCAGDYEGLRSNCMLLCRDQGVAQSRPDHIASHRSRVTPLEEQHVGVSSAVAAWDG